MGEVIKLPTASRRMVRQHCNKEGRAARAALREQCPWPGEYKSPWHRRIERESAELDEALTLFWKSPEIAMLLCIMQTLPSQQLAQAHEVSKEMLEKNAGSETVKAASILLREAHSRQERTERRLAEGASGNG